MSLALLLAATLVLVMLPMVPALIEWRRPDDAAPLVIEAGHGLDPSGFAESFADHLRAALERGDTHLGHSPLAVGGAGAAAGDWPLAPAELAAGCNHRVWHVTGDAVLPTGHDFLAGVACDATLATAPGGVYRALLGASRLRIAEGGVVLRWAHADAVDVASGCWLAGRVTATHRIEVDGHARFMTLHAPVVCFGATATSTAAALLCVPHTAAAAPPEGVAWDEVAGRGVAAGPLSIPAGRSWRGDLIGRGVLRIGAGCHAQGSLKSHGALTLGGGCRVEGTVIAQEVVRLNRGCTVLGSVVSETAVVLGPDCVVGAPGRPATVTAPRITVAPGAVVHGTVWATEHGICAGREAVARQAAGAHRSAPRQQGAAVAAVAA